MQDQKIILDSLWQDLLQDFFQFTMPDRKTKFNPAWLDQKDCNGDVVKVWCKSGTDEYHFKCIYCSPLKDLSCANRGWDQVNSHADGPLHKKKRTERKKQGIIQIVTVNKDEPETSGASNAVAPLQKPSVASASQQTQITFSIAREDTLRAEIIWSLKVAACNFSFRSCDGVVSTFQAMFTDSNIAKNMTLARSKVRYLISDGLRPIFLKDLVNDINNSIVFTLHFDEGTSKHGAKQLDLHIRFWSSRADEVKVSFYTAVRLGHAKGETVASAMLKALDSDGITLLNILTLGNDGPNVNKTVFRLINDQVIEVRKKPLVDIGSCSLHIVHNAFGVGIAVYGSDAQEFGMDMHSHFKASPARQEDLKDVQFLFDLEEHVFLRHVTSRWLTIGPVLERVIEQMLAIVHIWDKYKKMKEEEKPKSLYYKRIALKLEKKDVLLVRMHFLCEVAKLLNGFLKFFQGSEPLIHLLHDKMKETLELLERRCVKPRHITAESLATIDTTKHEVQLPYEEMIIGEKTREALKKLSSSERKQECIGMLICTAYNISCNIC